MAELLDIGKESRKVKDGSAGGFARHSLMARRLSEAGTRFVEIGQPGWDHIFG